MCTDEFQAKFSEDLFSLGTLYLSIHAFMNILVVLIRFTEVVL